MFKWSKYFSVHLNFQSNASIDTANDSDTWNMKYRHLSEIQLGVRVSEEEIEPIYRMYDTKILSAFEKFMKMLLRVGRYGKSHSYRNIIDWLHFHESNL